MRCRHVLGLTVVAVVSVSTTSADDTRPEWGDDGRRIVVCSPAISTSADNIIRMVNTDRGTILKEGGMGNVTCGDVTVIQYPAIVRDWTVPPVVAPPYRRVYQNECVVEDFLGRRLVC